MKAVTFSADIPRYIATLAAGKLEKSFFTGGFSCTKLSHIDIPKLPDENWVRIKTTYSGICGSDLNVIFLKDSPSTSPFVSFPFVFGHEVTGVISETGTCVHEFRTGDRVVVNPLLNCRQRNIEPLCPACLSGQYSRCESFAEGSLSPGLSTGFCRDTGGGWGEYFVAHKSQLYKIPEQLPDREMVFADPLASALHPILRHLPQDDEKILVIGAGVIGLLIIASIRALGLKCHITCLARYHFQGELAARYGADEVIYSDHDLYDQLCSISGGKLYKPILGKKFMIGGFQKVFDCVASSATLDLAIRFTKAGGEMVLVGLASFPEKIDWSPVWFKEIRISGSFYYEDESNCEEGNSFRCAVKMITDHKIDLSPLITHEFGIKDYKKAIRVASDKKLHKSVKVLFHY